jgi:hypothetical protein
MQQRAAPGKLVVHVLRVLAFSELEEPIMHYTAYQEIQTSIASNRQLLGFRLYVEGQCNG